MEEEAEEAERAWLTMILRTCFLFHEVYDHKECICLSVKLLLPDIKDTMQGWDLSAS